MKNLKLLKKDFKSLLLFLAVSAAAAVTMLSLLLITVLALIFAVPDSYREGSFLNAVCRYLDHYKND